MARKHRQGQHGTKKAPRKVTNGNKHPSSQPGKSGMGGASNPIAAAIGNQVRDLRGKLNLTAAELAAQAGLSGGMISKIENGSVLASIDSLEALARVFNVPLATLLARYSRGRSCTYVPRGGGFAKKRRRGIPTDHVSQLLGRSISGDAVVELYLVTLTEEACSSALFSDPGTEFVYVLQGRFIYHHAGMSYSLSPGDVLFFDSGALHGPGDLTETPVSYLSWRHRAPGFRGPSTTRR